MYKVLVVDDIVEITEIIAMFLEAEFPDIETIQFNSGNQTIEYLKNNDDVSLLICDHNMPDGRGSEVYEYIKTTADPPPFVLISTNSFREFETFHSLLSDHPGNGFLLKPFNEDHLFKLVKKALALDSLDHKDKIRLPLDLAKPFIKDFFDIFIKLDGKIIRFMDDSESSDDKKFKALEEKGLNEIYVNKTDYLQWVRFKLEKVHNDLEPFPYTSPKTPKAMVDILFRQAAFVFNILEPNDLFLKQLAQEVEKFIEEIWKNKNLKAHLIKRFSQIGYTSGHSAICLVLSFLFIKENNHLSKSLFKKLAVASLFHDISLESDEEASAITIDDVIDIDLTTKEKDELVLHPFRSAELLEKWEDVDNDVLRIIREHHELPNGKGYPRKIASDHSHKLSEHFQFMLNLSHYLYQNGELGTTAIKDLSQSFEISDYDNLISKLQR